jgi:hypothetical protein
VTAHEIFVGAFPVVLGAVLAMGVSAFTEFLKTRHEYRQSARERQEKELTQLNVLTSAIVYNVEILLHVVMQQILPHHEQSDKAAAALRAATTAEQQRVFAESVYSNFTGMMTRCPEPYFVEVNVFKDTPFVLTKDPELLSLSGWMVSYTRLLKDALSERNKRIDIATSESAAKGLTIPELEEQIRIQRHLGDIEVH